MLGKRRFEKRYLIIIIIVIIAIVLVILSVALNKDRELSFPEKIIKDSGTFVVDIASFPVNFLKESFRASKEKNEVYKKYKDLKEKEDELNSITAENKDLKDEIKKLKEELELNTVLSDKVFTNATIVNRNIDYWYNEVTIDKGSKSGIKKNMAVVNSDGLIGKISKTSNYYSTVKLMSDDKMSDKISVKISVGDSFVYGLISGYDSKTNCYTVEGISENVDIPKKSEVLTTGMGDIFPSGILVGQVTKVTKDNFDLSAVALVKSSVDFDNIDYVSVLKRDTK